MGTGSFPWVKRPRRVVEHPPYLAPRLKKEYSYTSTPSLGLRGLLQDELYFSKKRALGILETLVITYVYLTICIINTIKSPQFIQYFTLDVWHAVTTVN
jgi:hypothetical protein